MADQKTISAKEALEGAKRGKYVLILDDLGGPGLRVIGVNPVSSTETSEKPTRKDPTPDTRPDGYVL